MRKYPKTSANGRRSFLLIKQQMSLEERRSERELFFWTAHQWIRLVVTVALAAYLIISLVTGHDPLPQWLVFWK
jgi:hypothetical protein